MFNQILIFALSAIASASGSFQPPSDQGKAYCTRPREAVVYCDFDPFSLYLCGDEGEFVPMSIAPYGVHELGEPQLCLVTFSCCYDGIAKQ